jgi:DUF971 family protein
MTQGQTVSDLSPTKLELTDDDHLAIDWNDGQRRVYTFSELREACPCATCREKRTAAENEPAVLLPVISPEEARPLKIEGMEPVGGYAYSIAFSDGHDTGIFTFEHLRSLGRDAPIP